MEWKLIPFDGWNIDTGNGVICTDLDFETAKKIVDKHNGSLPEEQKANE